jgi:Ca2+-transporting ATPase
MGFVTLVAGTLAVIVANRASRAAATTTLFAKNVPLFWVAASTLAALAATIYWPPLARLFGFAALAPFAVLLCLAAGLGSVLVFEALRAVFPRRRRAQ